MTHKYSVPTGRTTNLDCTLTIRIDRELERARATQSEAPDVVGHSPRGHQVSAAPASVDRPPLSVSPRGPPSINHRPRRRPVEWVPLCGPSPHSTTLPTFFRSVPPQYDEHMSNERAEEDVSSLAGGAHRADAVMSPGLDPSRHSYRRRIQAHREGRDPGV